MNKKTQKGSPHKKDAKEKYKDYIKRGLSTKAHADKLMKKYKETGDPKLKERIKKQLRLTKSKKP